MFRLLRPFEFHEPASVEEAVALLSTYGDGARVLAGGTDLVVSMKKRELGPEHVIAISQLAELDFMELDADGSLRLGPLVTHAAIARSPIVREHFAMLATACNEVGTPQIRNMGTIGGNVCKAGPSQDTPPVLVALEAQLTLVGPLGERIVPLDQFCTGPFCTVMFADELLTQIRIPPLPPGGVGCYTWCTKITATDETLVGAAVVLVVDRGSRMPRRQDRVEFGGADSDEGPRGGRYPAGQAAHPGADRGSRADGRLGGTAPLAGGVPSPHGAGLGRRCRQRVVAAERRPGRRRRRGHGRRGDRAPGRRAAA